MEQLNTNKAPALEASDAPVKPVEAKPLIVQSTVLPEAGTVPDFRPKTLFAPSGKPVGQPAELVDPRGKVVQTEAARVKVAYSKADFSAIARKLIEDPTNFPEGTKEGSKKESFSALVEVDDIAYPIGWPSAIKAGWQKRLVATIVRLATKGVAHTAISRISWTCFSPTDLTVTVTVETK